METTIGVTVLEVTEGDITRETTDAIVNAANSGLMGGGGVDGAIHRAGGPEILAACQKIRAERGRLPVGQAVITTGGKLPARYVIHTVGPMYHASADPAGLLARCHRESLRIAVENGLKSVAFPAISTGAYGYPLDEAARVAVGAVSEFLAAKPPLDRVRFVLFGAEAYSAFEAALRDLRPEKGTR